MLIHPWETGRDNSIEWDAPLWRVVPEVTVVHRRDTDSVDAAERPTDEHYRRYLTLVRRGTAIGWRPAAARGERRRSACSTPASRRSWRAPAADLAWLAEQLGEAAHRRREPRGWPSASAPALRARADSDGLIRPVDAIDEHARST